MTDKRNDKQGTKEAAEVIPLRRSGAAGKAGRKGGARCPVCGKPQHPEHRPFCSTRCAEIDLGRWLKGVYRVPTDEAPGEEDLGGQPDDEEPK